MSSPTILGALIDTAAHPDLTRLTTIDDVTLVPAAIAPASVILICADGATLAVRYMAALDVLHGIRSGRLDADLLGLKERSNWAYLLIGGVMAPDQSERCRYGSETTGWSWDAYQGALLSAQEIGVGVLTLAHADRVSDALTRLARRDRGPKRVRPLRDALFTDPGTDMLMALPHIGEAMADQLLTYCGGNVGAALLALTSDEASAPGIGPKIREAARRVLGGAVGPLTEPTQTAKKAA